MNFVDNQITSVSAFNNILAPCSDKLYQFYFYFYRNKITDISGLDDLLAPVPTMKRFLFDLRWNDFMDITPVKKMLAPWKGDTMYLRI
jgi:hypothetical protein